MIKKIDLLYCTIFTLLNLFFLSIFLYYSPFDIECDGALFFKSGKFFYDFFFSENYSIVLNYRPPAFPFYLIFTGSFFFDSLYPFVIANVFLTLISPILIYFTLNYYGKLKAFIFTIFFLFSTLLYINLKSSLELHLIIFFIILNITSLINFYNKKKIIFLYLIILSGLLATFTRFDVIFVLVLDLLFLIYFLIKDKSLFKNVAICFSIVGTTFGLWMVAKFLALYFFYYSNSGNLELRQYAKNNKVSLFISSVTSLNHLTGGQLLWRINNDIRGAINSRNNYEPYVYNFLDIKNGPNSQKLYKQFEITFAKDKTWKHISEFREHMHPLGVGDKRNKYQVFYDDYWRFKNNSKDLVKNIFSKNYESLYYPMQIPFLLANDIGPIEADRLLSKVNIEIIMKNWEIKKELLQSIFYLYSKTSYSGEYIWYNYSVIKDIGGCATMALSKKMYDQYSVSYDKNSSLNNQISLKITKMVQSIKNFYRIFSAILLSILIFVFLYSKQKFLVLFLILNFLSLIILIGIFGGTANSKYENYISIFLFFILFLLSLPLLDYLNKKLKKFKKNI
jgi:hypothetical protein